MMNQDLIEKRIRDFANSIFYLDWNVYSYLSNISETSTEYQNKGKSFDFILKNCFEKDKICLPYSEAHYRDIILGSPDLYNTKLDYLYSITQGWKVSESSKDRNFVYINKLEKKDFFDDFASYKASAPFSNSTSGFNKLNLNILAKALTNNPALKPIQDKLIKIISDDDSSSELQILKINKIIRNSDFVKKSKDIIYPSVGTNVLQENNEIHEIVNKALVESNIDYNIVDRSFDLIKNLCLSFMSEFSFELFRLLFLCDFIGLSNEKLKKKTAFQGMITDSLHLSIALRLPVFVSEDKNLLIKARFIKKWMNLSVNIFDMDSFIQTVLKHIYKKNENESIEISLKENDVVLYECII